MIRRKRLRSCPVCGSSRGQWCEADEEQLELGYPKTFKLCETCLAPMVEVGDGHVVPFERVKQ